MNPDWLRWYSLIYWPPAALAVVVLREVIIASMDAGHRYVIVEPLGFSVTKE